MGAEKWDVVIPCRSFEEASGLVEKLGNARILGVIQRRPEPEPSGSGSALTPCGSQACTGCNECGVPALGIAPRADRTSPISRTD